MSQYDEEILSALKCDGHGRDEKIEIFLRNVSIINIETSSACNRVCIYCPNSKYDRKQQVLMESIVWDRFVDNIKEIGFEGMVSMNLYNEPLMDTTIYEKISEVKSVCDKATVKISTNGDYLNSSTYPLLEKAGLDETYVTLHVPTGLKWSDERQVKAFYDFFRRCNLSENPKVDVEPGKKISSVFNIGDIKVFLFANNWEEIGNDRAGALPELSAKAKERTNPCMRVFREFTISHIGEVFPCCQFFPDSKLSKKYVLGSLKDDDIWDIYASNAFVKWRREMFVFSQKKSPCKSCADLDNAGEPCRRQTLVDRVKEYG